VEFGVNAARTFLEAQTMCFNKNTCCNPPGEGMHTVSFWLYLYNDQYHGEDVSRGIKDFSKYNTKITTISLHKTLKMLSAFQATSIQRFIHNTLLFILK